MIVNVYNEQQDFLFDASLVPNLVEAVLREENKYCDEVSIYFVDKSTISELHLDYFNDPSPTDCITFPLDPPLVISSGKKNHFDAGSFEDIILGEVFVCPAVALEYAQHARVDPFQETSLYIVHGVLHLLGYDDIKDEDRANMRAAEQRVMDKLIQKQLLLR